LGKLPGAVSSSAYGINNLAEIAGSATMASGQSHAVVWKDGKAIDLGAQYAGDSYAVGINDNGQVVGRALSAVTVWNDNTGTQIAADFDQISDCCEGPSEYHIRYGASAINNSGQIVGGAISFGFIEEPFYETGAVVWNANVNGPPLPSLPSLLLLISNRPLMPTLPQLII
jgi:probable HAF family extracellular repeat protein